MSNRSGQIITVAALIALEFLAAVFLGPLFNLFLLFLLSILLGLVVFRLNPFYIVLAFLPFSKGFLQVEIADVTLNPYILGMLAATMVAFHRIIIKRERYSFRAVDLTIILLCFFYLVSTLYADDPKNGGLIAFHALFVPVISYFSLKKLITNENTYRKVLIALTAGITGLGVFTIASFAITGTRPINILGVPVISAATLLFFAIAHLLYEGWWKKRWGKAALFVLLLALGATLARAYWVFLLASPFLFRAIKRGRAFAMASGFLLLSLLATLLLVNNPERLRPRKLEHVAEEGVSLARVTNIEFWKKALYERAFVYRQGFVEFLKHPMFGKGFYRGWEVLGVASRHNFHVEWLETGGVVGWLLYSLVFLFHFQSAGGLAASERACAINLLILFCIMCNGFTNNLTTGMHPYAAFVVMGLNEARLNMRGIHC